MSYLNEKVTVAKDFYTTRGTDVSTSGTISALTNDGSSFIRLTAATQVTSIVAASGGKELVLVNANTVALLIKNLSGTAANQIITGIGLDISLPAGASIFLKYDDAASKWRVVGDHTATLLTSSLDLNNLEFESSVSANALQINVDAQSNGSSPDSNNVVSIGMRTTATNVAFYALRTISSSLTITVPSGATLGHASGVSEPIYIYAMDGTSGTMELAVSTSLFDDKVLQSTTAISAGATSRTVLYSTTARTNRPIRLVAKFFSNQTAAGTWATNPQIQTLNPDDTLARKIAGDVSGTVAPKGYIGEVIQTTISTSTNAATTNTFLALGSIALTPGVWLISGYAQLQRANATLTSDASIVIGTTSASISGSVAGYTNIAFTPTTITSADFNSGAIPMYPVSISSNTTYYLNVLAQYSAGTPQWRGVITAVRIA